MTAVAWTLVFLPFLAAFLGAADAFGPGAAGRRRERAAGIAVTGAVLATGLALVLAVKSAGQGEIAVSTFLLAPTGGVDVTVGVLVDGLSTVVALMVALVALGVQVYSV